MKYMRADGTWGSYPHKLQERDLDKLDRYLAQTTAVVPLREIASGDTRPGVVAMRHDVDHNLDHAITFAEWENERGYRATYYILHTCWYYDNKPDLHAGLARLVDLGHEIGFHSNATMLAASEFPARERWHTPGERLSDPAIDRVTEILDMELGDLRAAGFDITGMAAHGDIGCYEMGVFNDLRFTRLNLERFGLAYDADRLARGAKRITDNHGRVHGSLLTHDQDRQTFALVHPCHWALPARAQAVA